MKKNQPTLNKDQVRDGFMQRGKELSHILPSPAVLESYEELHPGMIEKLFSMVEKEQAHRHSLENKKVLYEALASHIALLIKIIVIGSLTITLSIFGDNYIALGFLLVTILFLFKKKVGHKKQLSPSPSEPVVEVEKKKYYNSQSSRSNHYRKYKSRNNQAT